MATPVEDDTLTEMLEGETTASQPDPPEQPAAKKSPVLKRPAAAVKSKARKQGRDAVDGTDARDDASVELTKKPAAKAKPKAKGKSTEKKKKADPAQPKPKRKRKKELLHNLFDLGDQVARAREEDAGDAEAEDGLESGRDRSKAQKFKKMLAEESLQADQHSLCERRWGAEASAGEVDLQHAKAAGDHRLEGGEGEGHRQELVHVQVADQGW